MWAYKLVTNDGDVFYYDSNELELARYEQDIFGGILTDRTGKEI